MNGIIYLSMYLTLYFSPVSKADPRFFQTAADVCRLVGRKNSDVHSLWFNMGFTMGIMWV